MLTSIGHLTYCSNIHTGENWIHHFDALREHIPSIKKSVSPDRPFGIGLRLSHLASVELGENNNLKIFKDWLEETQCYVFTMNGFPYGGFHHTKVKDLVHKPDWTTQDRVIYTIQLFKLLSILLPEGMEGGISTSPLSYKHWHHDVKEEKALVFETATENILMVVQELIRFRGESGKLMHLDIEPEPDGLIESGQEFLLWYKQYLLPRGITFLKSQLGLDKAAAIAAIKDHVQLCYDICHFAVGYENHADILKQLQAENIKVGKIQISAALKASMSPASKDAIEAFRQFNEATYLHQVVAMQHDGTLLRYPDLPEALNDVANLSTKEWRSHFHVPLFVKDYGVLQSTQEDIVNVLSLHKENPFTKHLEIETYTWEVLPDNLKLPLQESIIRELDWFKKMI